MKITSPAGELFSLPLVNRNAIYFSNENGETFSLPITLDKNGEFPLPINSTAICFSNEKVYVVKLIMLEKLTKSDTKEQLMFVKLAKSDSLKKIEDMNEDESYEELKMCLQLKKMFKYKFEEMFSFENDRKYTKLREFFLSRIEDNSYIKQIFFKYIVNLHSRNRIPFYCEFRRSNRITTKISRFFYKISK